MAKKGKTTGNTDLTQALISQNEDRMRELVRDALNDFLEQEMTEHLGAAPSERCESRKGYRAGYYSRMLITRVGALELRVPRDRSGSFSPELFDRFQRSERAFVASLAEMYIQGVSTRKVKAVTEQLCGHEFSASTISNITKKLTSELKKAFERPLEEGYPYLILDARYEKVREEGIVQSKAILIAIGVNWDGRREILAVDSANRESGGSWKLFLERLRERGLHGVEFVVSDDHSGLKRAIREILPEARWQRCYVHFLRNALDYLPRKADDDCLRELRWIYERQTLLDAQRSLSSWLKNWQPRYPKLCDWVEENIGETLSYYSLPIEHHKHLKSTNMLERLNQEIKRRTHIVRIFPNEESCLRLIRALAIEIHEDWLESHRYLNMSHLKEHKKAKLQQLEQAA